MPTTVPSETAILIAQLSSADIAIRDAAQAALSSADTQSIELLQRTRDATNDPDLQLRLDSILVRYAEHQAIGASKITLKFDNATLKEVLDEFTKQCGIVFMDPQQDFGNDPPRVTMNIENATFWQALSELQSAGNLNVLPQADNWRVMRNFGNRLVGTNSIEAGAFLIQPVGANYNRSIAYMQNGGGGENFNLTMQILSEPKVRLAQAAGQFRLTKAIDSNGNNLMGANSLQTFGTNNGQNQFHVATQLSYPKNPGEKIVELSGTMKLNMARRVETFSIDDFNAKSKPLEQMFEGAKITITPSEAQNGQPANWIHATIILEAQGDNTLLQRLQPVLRQVRVFDQNGRAMNLNQFQGTTVNAQRAEFRVSFMPIGNVPQTNGPYRLVLEIPTSFREVEIPFTLRDLKMP